MDSRYPHSRRFIALAALAWTALPGCGPLVLIVDDAAVTRTEREVRLAAYLERQPVFGVRSKWPNVPITFLLNGRVVGEARTNPDGIAELTAPIQATSNGHISARANHEGRNRQAEATLYVWDKDKTAIVLDIDHTIAQPDLDVLLFKPTDFGSTILPGAQPALAALKPDFQFFYLTARPRFLVDKTRRWLRDNEFPEGPVIPTAGIREMLDRTDFKRKILAGLRQRLPNVLVGIGNSKSDAEAYHDSHMLTLLVSRKLKESSLHRTIPFVQWNDLRRFVAEHRSILTSPERLAEMLGSDRLFAQLAAPVR